MTWTLNILGPFYMALTAAIYLGAFGGSAFETGVAGLLALTAGDIASWTFKGDDPWLKWAVLAMMPVSITLLVIGFVLMLGGLS